MKRTALLTLLSVCACLIYGCTGSTTQTGEATTATESTEVTEAPSADESVVTEEPEKTEEPEDIEAVKADEAAAEEEPVELIVFAAASMTETMEEIAKAYKEVAPNVTITYNFDSSGTLKTQIEEGADCDIFISAASKQMNQRDITKDE